MRERLHRPTRFGRDSNVLIDAISRRKFPNHFGNLQARRWAMGLRIAAVAIVVLLHEGAAHAQMSPWERAAMNLEFTFTGPLARSLALVAIVIGGLMFMFGEGGAKRQISGIVFGGGLALFATQFMTWLF